MAGKFCTQCGAAAAEGKAFCSRCGNRLGQSAPTTQTAGPSAAATRKFCTQCGEPVQQGKRFCRHCGKAVDSPALPVQPAGAQSPVPEDVVCTSAVATSAQEDVLAPSEVNAQEDVSPPSVAIPALMVRVAVPEQATIAPAAVSAREEIAADPSAATASPQDVYVPIAATLPAVATMAPAEPTIVQAAPQPQKLVDDGGQKRFILPIALTLAALVLVAAGAFVWHYRQHLGLSRILHPGVAPPAPVATALPTTVAAQPQPSPAPTPQAAQNVPSAPRAQPSALASPASQAPTGKPSPAPHPHVANPPVDSSPFSPPAPAVMPPAPEAPAPARSGTLYYTGPPVPFGGTVVFSGLPAGRLRFVFDHQSWQPLISHQSDGTQTLTLRSLRLGEQAKCDVQWELAP